MRPDSVMRVLMIAFHYPPYSGGSGIHRTLKFSSYLPDHGWRPIVLSANPTAYPKVGEDQVGLIPQNVLVKRVFALDTARHLSVRAMHLKWMALPDRWISWFFWAVPAGLRLIRKHRPKIIWSTYPIATAHLIGLALHRLTGVPWVADFRDSMAEDNYPADLTARRSYLWIEKQAVRYSSRLIFTAQSTLKMYLKRYPDLQLERCLLLPNGFDEEDFKGLDLSKPSGKAEGRRIRLIHAGFIYPDERDPRPFFRALSRLKKEGRVTQKDLAVHLRASGSEEYYASLIRELGIDDIVQFLQALPYQQALQDCADSDALLIFQGPTCSHQIPAKAYEYLRLQRPILALTPDPSDTALLLRETGGATIVDLGDEEAIYWALPGFLEAVARGVHPLADQSEVQRYARKNQAGDLARCLSQVVNGQEKGP